MGVLKKIIRFLLSFGPGIFAIGYTIGTGSVTSMIVAGNSFGMQLLWVLFFSCLFSGVLIYVSGSYYLYTGETALYAIKKHLPVGKLIAIAIIATVGIGQWNSLIGILGIASNVVFEILALNFPSLLGHKYEVVLALALRTLHPAAKCLCGRGRSTPLLPGHRNRYRIRQKRTAGLDRRW